GERRVADAADGLGDLARVVLAAEASGRDQREHAWSFDRGARHRADRRPLEPWGRLRIGEQLIAAGLLERVALTGHQDHEHVLARWDRVLGDDGAARVGDPPRWRGGHREAAAVRREADRGAFAID